MGRAVLPVHSDGTTFHETFLAIFACCLHAVATISVHSKFNIQYGILKFLMDFSFLIIPSILSFTLLSDYNLCIALLQVINIYLLNKHTVSKVETVHTIRTDFITNFRSITNLLSVIAILAVDFKIFPRGYSKTETYGYSVMDTGVGLFVFANGIVAPEVRNRKDSIKKSIIGSIPLMTLGIGRCLFVKQTSYNVPISEYGVHWNFFITLTVIKIFASLILNIVNVKYIYINSTLLILAHEVLLQSGLGNFAFENTKRNTFVIANKEGLVSSLGYISLYLFSVYFGYFINISNVKKEIPQTVIKFFQGVVFSLIMFIVFQSYFGVSRRLANGGYCFWILSIAILFLGSLYIIQECVFTVYYSCYIIKAINYNGLAFFLLGNFLTGFINLSIDTSTVDEFHSLLIIILYMFLNCMVVCILYHYNIKIKL